MRLHGHNCLVQDVVAYSGLYVIRLQSFHWGYSSSIISKKAAFYTESGNNFS